jgi:excisionase family DNA binding protein
MTTKELSQYLKLHEITICKYASEGKIPAIWIGSVWRFDKDVSEDLISADQNEKKAAGISHKKGTRGESGKKIPGNETIGLFG